ncbi:glycosyltransferase [Roseovarius sp. S4756]|uniref:glycosyltransferase n=1 Tax=Roseovarius maritimus TaxID=3342637 RepID=UPI00372C4514
MTDLLILTTLDVEGRRNNREHHAIAHLKSRFDRITVVFRQRGKMDKPAGRYLVSGQSYRVQDGVRYVAVDPALNPPEGRVRGITGSDRPGGFGLRRCLAQAIDLLGILRDRLTIRALAAAAADEVDAGANTTVCVAFGPWAATAAHRLRTAGRIAKFVYVDRDYEPGFVISFMRRNWAEMNEMRAAAAADLTFSIGHRLAARFADVPGAKVVVSPTGVDSATFRARQRNEPRPDLIFVGRLAPWSGIEEMLDAFDFLSDLDPSLTVLGPVEPGYRAYLEDRIAASDLGGAVTLMGDQPRDVVARALEAASIGSASFRPTPLRIHAAPLKLLEYMAAGLPVIAVEGSETGDMTLRLGVGLVCKTDGPSLAATIRTLLAAPADYRAMSTAGPVAAQDFEWSRIMAREYDHLSQLYGLGPAPSARRRRI